MASAEIEDSGTPREGDVIAGKYRVERVLGAGGMGVVVEARHLELSQRVAIKFLLPNLAKHADPVARFLREARAAAGIRSEHVARVLDVGRLETGVPYMVMEHLAGKDLEQVVEEQGPLCVADAVNYVLQACEALAEAHAIGIVHRDLKPSNLFLTRRSDGTPFVKVLDFGIAKVASAEVQAVDGGVTATGSTMGSPRYMSPEQIRNAKHVDARADIWALGIILHELVTGRAPFDADAGPALCAMIVADEPIPLRVIAPDAPEELETLILRCLEKEPTRRPRDVAELAEALRPLASSTSARSVDRVLKIMSSAALADTHAESSRRSARPAEDVSGPRSGARARSGDTKTEPTWNTEPPPVPRRSSTPRLALGGAALLVVAVGVVAVAFERDDAAPEPPDRSAVAGDADVAEPAFGGTAPSAPAPSAKAATQGQTAGAEAPAADPIPSVTPAPPTASAKAPKAKAKAAPSPVTTPALPPPAAQPAAPTGETKRDPLDDRK